MEMEITIPHWALWMIATFGGGWAVWMVFLTKMAFESKSDARSASEKDAVILGKISDVEKKIDDNKIEARAERQELNSKLDKIEDKIERLFGTEFAFIKSLVTTQQGSRPV